MFALEDLFDVKDIDQDGKKFDNGKDETELPAARILFLAVDLLMLDANVYSCMMSDGFPWSKSVQGHVVPCVPMGAAGSFATLAHQVEEAYSKHSQLQ